ncbi:MAG: hypothetical protein PXZ08_03225 [Actinomycetota bacterium]|nr:hypothetical protein [Actinomycetota bacterium]
MSTHEGLDSAFAPVIVSDDRRSLRTHLTNANPWTRSIQGKGTLSQNRLESDRQRVRPTFESGS